MRRSIYIIIGLAALFACKHEDPLAPFRDESKFVIPPAGSSITVMTYNIYGASGKADLDSIAAVINEAKPDFVMIQEVDSCTPRSGRTIQQSPPTPRLIPIERISPNFYYFKTSFIGYQ